MNDAPGHHWELRQEDAPNLMDKISTLRCTDCKIDLARRRVVAFRSWSFRDREAMEQFWAAHVAETTKVVKVERWPDADLLPY